MDIWMKVCTRRATCAYCSQPILKDSYMIVGKHWWKGNGSAEDSPTRHFRQMTYWHHINPEGLHCWEEQAIAAISSRPVILGKSGRPRISLSPEDKSARLKIMHRRNSTTQRIRVEVEKSFDPLQGKPNFELISHLGEILEQLKIEIEPYGGVPKSWGSILSNK